MSIAARSPCWPERREGVPAELQFSQGALPAAVLEERLARTLRDNLGLSEDVARWAVTTWAAALAGAGIGVPPSAEALAELSASLPVSSAPSLPAQAPPVPALSEAEIIDRLLALPLDEGGDLAWTVAGLLTVTDGPLTMADVAGVLGRPVRQVHRAIAPIADLIVRDGRLRQGGELFRRAVTGYLEQSERQSQREVLIRWCGEQVKSRQPGHDIPEYVLRHGAEHLAAEGDLEGLSTLVDKEWLWQSAARTGSPAAFNRDMLRVADMAAAISPPLRRLELVASLAGVTAASITSDVPPEALGVLAAAGQPEHALELAALVTPWRRSDGYYRIARALRTAGSAQAADTAAAAAIEAAASNDRESGIFYALESLGQSIVEGGTPRWAAQAAAALQAAGAAGYRTGYLVVQLLAKSGDASGAWQAARQAGDGSYKREAFAEAATALARAGRTRDAIVAANEADDNAGGILGNVAEVTAERGDVAATLTVIGSAPDNNARQWPVMRAGEVWARTGRVDDIPKLIGTLSAEDHRRTATEHVADVLARSGQIARAVGMWRAVASGAESDYLTPLLVKSAADASDIDGALQIASALPDYARGQALTHVASAVARAGDLPRAAEIARTARGPDDVDSILSEVAKDLVAHERFDDAVAVAGMIGSARVKAGSQVVTAVALAAAGQYPRSAALAEEAAQSTARPGGAVHIRALLAWSSALARSSRPDQAVDAAERAVSLAREGSDQGALADALATWSGTLNLSGHANAAVTAATEVIGLLRGDDVEPDYHHARWAHSVAVLLAETGPPDEALEAARFIADYNKDKAYTEIATALARRGLADQAIKAARATTPASAYNASEKVKQVARDLAKHGHVDGALRAVAALADLQDDSSYAEYVQASLLSQLARTLADADSVDAALAMVQATPVSHRPKSLTEVVVAVAVAGDIGRALELAEPGGAPALAKAADALAEAGRTSDAVQFAEQAVRHALAAPPTYPGTAEAIASLASMAATPHPGHNMRAGDELVREMSAEARALARRAARQARAVTPLTARALVEGAVAVKLAHITDAEIRAEAVALAGQARQDARTITDPAERATALGNSARALAAAEEPALAAETARECLAMADANKRPGVADLDLQSAVGILAGTGRLTEALTALSSLSSDISKARALVDVANRLASNEQAADLVRLAEDSGVIGLIVGAWERFSALAAMGVALARVGQVDLASRLAGDAAALASELTRDVEKAVAHADQAELLAALQRGPEAVEQARQALAVGRQIGAWRGYVITKAVNVLAGSGELEEAVAAARSAPSGSSTGCLAAAAIALFDAGQPDRAAALIGEALAGLRTAGDRWAFYDLTCTHLTSHPDLFHAWVGSETDTAQIGAGLAEIEQWWA